MLSRLVCQRQLGFLVKLTRRVTQRISIDWSERLQHMACVYAELQCTTLSAGRKAYISPL